jgi:hypothetical protein
MGAFGPEALVPLNPSNIERMQTSAAGPMNGYEQRPTRGQVREATSGRDASWT